MWLYDKNKKNKYTLKYNNIRTMKSRCLTVKQPTLKVTSKTAWLSTLSKEKQVVFFT